MRRTLSIIFVVTFLLTLGIGSAVMAGSACCPKGNAKTAAAAGCADMKGAAAGCAEMGKMGSTMTERATMGKVLTGKQLYSCPDHTEVVSVHEDHSCPLDKKPLKKMSGKATRKLRGKELYGCPMCPVIKTASDEDLECTMCGMDLVKVEAVKEKG